MQDQVHNDLQEDYNLTILFGGIGLIICGILMQIRTDFGEWTWLHWIFLWPFALFEILFRGLITGIGIGAIILGGICIIIWIIVDLVPYIKLAKYNYNEDYFYSEESNYENVYMENEYFKKAISVFGLKINYSEKELKYSYKNIMKEYHPDKYTNERPEIKKLVEEKAKDANEMYEYLLNWLPRG